MSIQEKLNTLRIKESLKEKLLDKYQNDALFDELLATLINHEEEQNKIIKKYESYQKSPFLKGSVDKIEYSTILRRDVILEKEFGKKIDETSGTMFYFKEKAKELAHIVQLDPDEIRMAFTEGIQNILEHGQGKKTEITMTVNNINSENAYFEMSFKHYMEEKEFYSLKEANRSADRGMIDFENSRGRGEFMMREIMDERKFINGLGKKQDGKNSYFFQRIMRKYKNSKPRGKTRSLSNEFKKYIDSLDDYRSALFVRMDYFLNKKELVLSEQVGKIEKIQEIMNKYGYKYNGSDKYKKINFSFWETDLENEDKNIFDKIISELKDIIEETTRKE